MAVLMVTRGHFSSPFPLVVGRISECLDTEVPRDTILLCRQGRVPDSDLSAFAAVLVEGDGPYGGRIGAFHNLDHLKSGDVVSVNGRTGRTRTIYRRASPHNALFVTERCNNNCLMCSQPPKPKADELLRIAFRLIDLLKVDPPIQLGVTGGEPTLNRQGLLQLLSALRDKLPKTVVTVLSNGRTLRDPAFVKAVADVGHPALRFTIPLHADVPHVHDYIAQAKGAFSDTVAGLYNLADNGVEAEIRVVLHALSVPRLVPLAEYVYRKLPFLHQVAFMGLENVGHAKRNWELLWIDPMDYMGQLQNAVEYLYRCGMSPSLYNLPLCVLPPSIWAFACQSISDYKQILIEECKGCGVAEHCAGFFVSGKMHHSVGIRPVVAPIVSAPLSKV